MRVAAGVAQAVQHRCRRPRDTSAVVQPRRTLSSGGSCESWTNVKSLDGAARRREQRRAERAREQILVRMAPLQVAVRYCQKASSEVAEACVDEAVVRGQQVRARSFRSSCSSGRRSRRRTDPPSTNVSCPIGPGRLLHVRELGGRHAAAVDEAGVGLRPRRSPSRPRKARSPGARDARPRRRAGSPCRSPPASRRPATAPRGRSDRRRSCWSRSLPAACPTAKLYGPWISPSSP